MKKLVKERIKKVNENGFLNYFELQGFGVRSQIPTLLLVFNATTLTQEV